MALAGGKFALGALIFGGLLVWLGPDWGEVARRVEIHWGYLSLALLGTTLATAFTAARWRLLNEHMTATRLPYSAYFHYIALTRFLGQFSSMLLMEFVGRSVGLKAAGSTQGMGRLLAPLLLERLIDLLLPMVLLGWAAVVLKTGASVHAWPLLAAVVVVFGIGVVPLIAPCARLALRGYARWRRFRRAAIELEQVDISPRSAAGVSLLSLGRYASVLLQFFAMAAAAGVVLDPITITSALPVAQLSAVVAITPGGLGIQDAGWVGALRWLALDEASIAVFLIAVRALVVANFGLLSLLTLPLSGRRRNMPPPSSGDEHTPVPSSSRAQTSTQT